MHGRVPARSSAIFWFCPQVFTIFALAIYEADRRGIDDSEHDEKDVEIPTLLFGPVDYSEQEEANRDFPPIGRHHMEPLGDPVVFVCEEDFAVS